MAGRAAEQEKRPAAAEISAQATAQTPGSGRAKEAITQTFSRKKACRDR